MKDLSGTAQKGKPCGFGFDGKLFGFVGEAHRIRQAAMVAGDCYMRNAEIL